MVTTPWQSPKVLEKASAQICFKTIPGSNLALAQDLIFNNKGM